MKKRSWAIRATLQIQSRFPDAEVVPCSRYGEIFNRRAQSFRLQKRRPSLILARKHRNFVQEAPPGFGVEGARSFVFSHMHNCIYDCRYCFLQGMYRSAHYVVFINYEDFQWEIEERLRSIPESIPGRPVWFFSGYDCDSLALEPVTRFAASFVPFFARFPHGAPRAAYQEHADQVAARDGGAAERGRGVQLHARGGAGVGGAPDPRGRPPHPGDGDGSRSAAGGWGSASIP